MESDFGRIYLSNPQLDKRIGGIPTPSLTLLEGANGSGKSTLSKQITYGALRASKKVLYISTDSSEKQLLENMEKLNYNLTMNFINGSLKILRINLDDVFWDKEVSKYYLLTLNNYINKKKEDGLVVIIDSLTPLLKNADNIEVINFFTEIKNIIEGYGVNYIINIHHYSIESNIFKRVSDICDNHIKLEKRTFRGKPALTLNIIKMNGALLDGNNIISFEIKENRGIKVLPFTSTKG